MGKGGRLFKTTRITREVGLKHYFAKNVFKWEISLKCLSYVNNGASMEKQHAAIQMSFSGIGVPFSAREAFIEPY
jgi:hypothetical protein